LRIRSIGMRGRENAARAHLHVQDPVLHPRHGGEQAQAIAVALERAAERRRRERGAVRIVDQLRLGGQQLTELASRRDERRGAAGSFFSHVSFFARPRGRSTIR
jgi:hypothetical protein